MKSFLILITSLLFSLSGFTQMSALVETEWHLVNLVVDNEALFPPNENADIMSRPFLMYFETEVTLISDNPQYYITDSYCGNGGNGFTEFSEDSDSSFQLSEMTYLAGGCDEETSRAFEREYLNLYSSGRYDYVITDETATVQRLEVINPSGMRAIYSSEEVLAAGGLNQVFPFSIFPNPVQNVLNITSEHLIDIVNIYDMKGQHVKVETSATIDISNLASAIYFVEVLSEGKKTIKKFVKQ